MEETFKTNLGRTMAVQKGHENLQPKEVFGFDGGGNIFVDGGDRGLLRYRLFVLPGGQLRAQPVEDSTPDQEGGEAKKPTMAERMRGVDQQ